MNATQAMMVLVPMVLIYGYFVLTAKSGGTINRWSNLFAGIIIVPLLLVLVPFILLGVCLNALKKRAWREGLITLSFLVLIVGYCGFIILLGDGPPPSPADLPVER